MEIRQKTIDGPETVTGEDVKVCFTRVGPESVMFRKDVFEGAGCSGADRDDAPVLGPRLVQPLAEASEISNRSAFSWCWRGHLCVPV